MRQYTRCNFSSFELHFVMIYLKWHSRLGIFCTGKKGYFLYRPRSVVSYKYFQLCSAKKKINGILVGRKLHPVDKSHLSNWLCRECDFLWWEGRRTWVHKSGKFCLSSPLTFFTLFTPQLSLSFLTFNPSTLTFSSHFSPSAITFPSHFSPFHFHFLLSLWPFTYPPPFPLSHFTF